MSDEECPKRRRIAAPGYTGLKNIGLKCFMNVVFQVLSNTVLIKAFFDNNGDNSGIEKGTISFHLRDTISRLWSGRYRSFSPRQLVRAILKKLPHYGDDEHDCHEFMMSLTSELHDELKFQNDDEDELETNSIIKGTFHGQHTVTIKCSKCSFVRRTTETYNHLSLALPESSVELKDVIREHFATETLDDFRCPDCSTLGSCISSTHIDRAPEVLVLCLKRLIPEFIHGECIMSKNRVEVDFPFTDLHFGDQKYNLYAVILHHAQDDTDEYGHYYSYCKNMRTGQWIEYDDRDVAEVREDDVYEPTRCYMLFYERMKKDK